MSELLSTQGKKQKEDFEFMLKTVGKMCQLSTPPTLYDSTSK
jgi:hypothetical protein